MKKILNNVIDSLNKSFEKTSTKIIFSSQNYKPFLLDKKNFHPINISNAEKRKIMFVDGGNSVILDSASFVVEFVRVFGCIFEGRKCIKKKKKESLIVVKLEKSQNNFVYSTEMFPVDGKSSEPAFLKFDIFEKSLKADEDSSSISQVAGAVRRFFELELAKELTECLQKGDVVVLDGILKTNSLHEKRFFDGLCSAVNKNSLVLCSVAKTTTLLTDSGDSAVMWLSKIAPKGNWYYHPVVEITDENHKADLFFAKLHNNSNYVFRVEFYKQSDYQPQKLFSLLASNSSDPVFLGYPYGLVYADRHARVSSSESA
ncbi:DNA double-strand break repair nuclease NurA [Candidatus Woesearchaeota archaeon]|nr:DNA double-strand break repair nuclease NurA [Candidatus Woesearchaeota archaeon]